MTFLSTVFKYLLVLPGDTPVHPLYVLLVVHLEIVTTSDHTYPSQVHVICLGPFKAKTKQSLWWWWVGAKPKILYSQSQIFNPTRPGWFLNLFGPGVTIFC